MSSTAALPPLNTPRKTEQGWVIDLPSDVLQIMGLEQGSTGLLHPRPGGLEVEILPPLSPEQEAEFEAIFEQSEAVFRELQRRGD
jgi:hypothetical protein